MTTDRTFRRLLVFHLGFAAAGAVVLATGVVSVRYGIWATVVAYNVALPAVFYRTGELEVVDLWTFLFPLSLLQILPDWYLATVQQTLVFPTAEGAFPVPLFMGGLWTFPLAVTTAVGLWVAWRWGTWLGYAGALACGLLVFAGGELALTRAAVWRPQSVTAVEGVALYILPAELLLVAATRYAYRTVRDKSVPRRLAAAAAVALFYLGAATTSYLLVETAVSG